MLKIFKSTEKIYHGFQKIAIQKRLFLSEAYRCEEAWKTRLQTPLLQKVDPKNLFFTLENKQNTTGKISAIDIDIFANTVMEKFQVEELLTLLYNLRLTAETSNTLESTQHAVIKFLLSHDCTEELTHVLHDRLNYGIFPDHVCYNILMNTYIKRKDYANGAKIAVLPMLQEDSENPITNALSVYTCHKYLENPDEWKKPEVLEDSDSKEEIKVRVGYLRNPFFDDHFDLIDPRDLVGKTLAFYGKIMNNTLGRTCQLRGLILYKKYQAASELIEQWLKENEGDVVYEELLDLIKRDNENILAEQATNEFKNVISQVEKLKTVKLCKDSITETLENEIKAAVDKQSHIDIAEQIRKYHEWENEREILLNKQLEEIKKQKAKKTIANIKKELEEQEEFLTFFDNEEKIELQVEELKKKDEAELEKVYRMRHARKKLNKLKEQEEYIPPTIEQQKN